MQIIKDFKLKDLQPYCIAFALTSEQSYEMDRLIVAEKVYTGDPEDWPWPEDYLVIEGGHCSCFDFDSTTWSATSYTKDELLKVMEGWKYHELEVQMRMLLMVYWR